MNQVLLIPDARGGDSIAEIGDPLADLAAIKLWVDTKRGSAHTRRAFNYEARRWLAWLMWARPGPASSGWLAGASSQEANAYIEFLSMTKAGRPVANANGDAVPESERVPLPFPVEILCRTGLQRPPFQYSPLQPASLLRVLYALKGMYADMRDMTFANGVVVVANPFNRIKLNATNDDGLDVDEDDDDSLRGKALTKREMEYVAAAQVALMELRPPSEALRIKWIWTALKWAAMRRHELAKAKAGDIRLKTDENGDPTWKISIRGKGRVRKSVPLSKVFMDAFCEYRVANGLPALPTSSAQGLEDTPLVLPLRGPMRHVSDETIYRSVKILFGQAALVAAVNDDHEAVSRLNKFASHTARHTQVTNIVDATGDITLGQDMARHASIATTRKYKAKSTSRLAKALNELGS